MKKIFLFGRLVRICFIFSFVFIIYAMLDICFQSSFEFKYIFLTVLVLAFVVFGMIWIYSLGLCFNYKTDRLILILGITKDNHFERVLSNIEAIDIEKNLNIGFHFVLKHKNGYAEKIEYKFYRISFIEEAQYKRLTKQISKMKLWTVAGQWLF